MIIAFIFTKTRESFAYCFRGCEGCCGACFGPVNGPFWVGCLAGFWFHFIPCIWWTCDFGPNDGQDVRGIMWWSVWAIMTIVGWVYNFAYGGYKSASAIAAASKPSMYVINDTEKALEITLLKN